MTRCATDTGTSHKGMNDLSKFVRGTLHDVLSTDIGTSHEGRYNPVLGSSTALYTNNSMLDNVSSFDRITAVYVCM